MKIYLSSQESKLESHLEEAMKCQVTHYDKKYLPDKTSTIKIDPEKSLKDVDLNCLHDYNIFPSNIMTYKTQWDVEQRTMQIGDTIVQQVFLPPIQALSLKIVFGVRINAIIDEPTQKGFSYETLEGHVEKGESTFTVEETDHGLIFKIRTFSNPGNFLTKLAGPVFSLPYQRYCTGKALENVKRQLVRS